MPTSTLPKYRQEFSKGIDDIPFTSKHRDDIARYTFDWANELASGETISTSAWAANGVTVSADSTTSTTTYATVTGTDGYVTNTVVTTGVTPARTLVKKMRFVGVPDGMDEVAYGG